MFLILFQRYKFLDVGLSTIIFFVLVGTILSKLKRYENETSKLYTFSDQVIQTVRLADWKKNLIPPVGGGDSMIAYAGRLHPKGIPFSGFRYKKG